MKKRIILVDDEEAVTRAMKRNLEATGLFEVMEINNPALVLENARQFNPDLVLLDVMMPEMDGGDVAAALAEDPNLANVPIIFLTGIVSKDEVGQSGIMRGKHTFLAKPIKFVELLYSIDEQLRTAG